MSASSTFNPSAPKLFRFQFRLYLQHLPNRFPNILNGLLPCSALRPAPGERRASHGKAFLTFDKKDLVAHGELRC